MNPYAVHTYETLGTMAGAPDDVADSLEIDFRRLLASADVVRPEQLVGEWTVKQIIAHIAAWDREMLTALGEVLAGRPAHYAGWDEDEYNRAIASRSQAESWESIRAEAVAAHAALVLRARAVRTNQWEQPASDQWADGSPMTPASVLAYVYKGGSHYAGHAGELEELYRR